MKKAVLFVALMVSVSLAAVDYTITQTAEQLADTYGWTTGGFYDSFQLDGVITFKANQPTSGNVNGYYSPDTPRDWRIYQARNNGEFSVAANPGYKIRSLKFVYTNKNTGVLSLVAGTNVESSYQVASGQTLLVDTNAITFYAGNTTTTTNGQVKLSQFTVTYYATDSAAVVERFSKVEQTKNNEEEVTWQGDYADWQVLCARRSVKDTLNGGVQASWCKSGGYFKTMARGGIKHIRFEWRQFVTDSVELRLAMSAGEVWQDTARIQAIPTQTASKNHSYETSFTCKQDVPLSFMNISTESATSQDRFLLGDIFITPYIYIAPENRLFQLDRQEGSFDVSSILRDNTEGEGEVVYTLLSDGTNGATLSGSVVDFSLAQRSGDIQVQVSWNDGQVTLAPVVLQISVVEETGEYFTECFDRCTKTQMTGTTYVAGDRDVFGWNLSNFTRQEKDMVGDAQGIQLNNGGSVMMNGAQEGGIKSIRFDYRRVSMDQAVQFIVWVDGNEYPVSYAAFEGDTIQQYTRAFNIDHNTMAGIQLGSKSSTAQSQIVVGPVSIAPYLLFRQRHDTVLVDSVKTIDLAPMLMDNTQGVETITYSIVQDETGAASLRDGVLSLDKVTTAGRIVVQAAWKEVTTTMTVHVLTAPTGWRDTDSEMKVPSKQLRNGRLVVMHNGTCYSILGSRL